MDANKNVHVKTVKLNKYSSSDKLLQPREGIFYTIK